MTKLIFTIFIALMPSVNAVKLGGSGPGLMRREPNKGTEQADDEGGKLLAAAILQQASKEHNEEAEEEQGEEEEEDNMMQEEHSEEAEEEEVGEEEEGDEEGGEVGGEEYQEEMEEEAAEGDAAGESAQAYDPWSGLIATNKYCKDQYRPNYANEFRGDLSTSLAQCKQFCEEEAACRFILFYSNDGGCDFMLCRVNGQPSRCELLTECQTTKDFNGQYTTALYQRQVQAPYVFAEDDTNVCPSGTARVQDEATCRSAAETLGLQFGNSGYWADYPKGCYKHGRVHFNTHVSGGSQTTYQPVCFTKAACEDGSGFVLPRETQIVMCEGTPTPQPRPTPTPQPRPTPTPYQAVSYFDFGVPYDGKCVDAGGAEGAGRSAAVDKVIAEDCWVWCMQDASAKGCTFYAPDRKCFSYSGNVVSGSGDSGYTCQIKAPTRPITLPPILVTGSEPVCPICMTPGKFPSKPGKILTIRFVGGPRSCTDLFYQGLSGNFPEFMCGVSQDEAQDVCGCNNPRTVIYEGQPVPAPNRVRVYEDVYNQPDPAPRPRPTPQPQTPQPTPTPGPTPNQGGPFVLGTYGTDVCPSGYEPIQSSDTCETAGQELGIDLKVKSSWPDFPKGCFKIMANPFFCYNTHGSGSSSQGAMPVCKAKR